MLKKITLKNFMSHSLTELDLVAGVNVLIGPNNCGKSAIVSALQLVAELPPKEGGYMVRHGEKEAQVMIETQEEDLIIWGRRGKVNTLEINGKPHVRLGNDQQHYLDELHKVLRLPQIKNKDESFDIHFAKQKEPIFLLNEPSTRAATFFSISSDAGRLIEMRELFKSKVSRAKEKQKNLARKQIALSQKIAHLTPLNDLKQRLLDIKEFYHHLVTETQLLERGKEEEAYFKKRTLEEKNLLEKKALLNQLLAPVEWVSVDSLELAIKEMKTLFSQEKIAIQKANTLRPLIEETLPLETAELDMHVQDFKKTAARYGLFKSSQKILDPLINPPECQNTSELQLLISQIEKEASQVKTRQKQASLLTTLMEPFLPQEVEKQQIIVSQLDRLENEISKSFNQDKILSQVKDLPLLVDVNDIEVHVKERKMLEKQLLHLVLQASQDNQALDDWMKEHPSCPTCGTQWEMDAHEGVLAHD